MHRLDDVDASLYILAGDNASEMADVPPSVLWRPPAWPPSLSWRCI